MFEALQPPDTVQSHVYRKARTVTAAVTASDFFAWKDGYATPELDKWLSDHIPANYDVYSYQRIFYQMFWRVSCGEEKTNPAIRACQSGNLDFYSRLAQH